MSAFRLDSYPLNHKLKNTPPKNTLAIDFLIILTCILYLLTPENMFET